MNETNIKQNEYFIYFSKSEEPIIISVKQDINRPNCPEDEEIISEYIEDNYGCIHYDTYTEFNVNKIIL